MLSNELDASFDIRDYSQMPYTTYKYALAKEVDGITVDTYSSEATKNTPAAHVTIGKDTAAGDHVITINILTADDEVVSSHTMNITVPATGNTPASGCIKCEGTEEMQAFLDNTAEMAQVPYAMTVNTYSAQLLSFLSYVQPIHIVRGVFYQVIARGEKIPEGANIYGQ